MQTEENIYAEPMPLSDETILESFKKFIEKDDSDEQLLAFLAKESEVALRKCRLPDGLMAEDEKELAEFYQYFMEHYREKTKEPMFHLWRRKETLILRLGEAFYDMECERKATGQITNGARQEAEKLFMAISRYLYGNRELHFRYSIPYDDWGLSISGRMSNRQRAEFRRCCLTSFAKVILYSGTMTLFMINQHTKSKKLIGIRGNGTTWLSASKDDILQEAACMPYRRSHAARFVEYIEISKE